MMEKEREMLLGERGRFENVTIILSENPFPLPSSIMNVNTGNVTNLLLLLLSTFLTELEKSINCKLHSSAFSYEIQTDKERVESKKESSIKRSKLIFDRLPR